LSQNGCQNIITHLDIITKNSVTKILYDKMKNYNLMQV
jgi:hypothetical protein